MRFAVSVIVICFLLIPLASAASGEFTVDTDMRFTGTSSDPATFYQDGVGGASGNSDVGIELCGLGQRYVGGFYAMNIASTWSSVLVTYSSSSNALALTTSDVGGGCFQALPGFVTVSPSYLTTPDPDVYRAALPGNLFIGYALSANPGSVTDFIYSDGNARLQGDYTVTRSFDQTSRQIAVSTPQITFTSTSGSFSKSASDSNFGINSQRQLIIGVCDDDYGDACDDGAVLTTATFPQTYNTGLSSGQVNDQNTYTKYVVLNGIGKQMCIGANIQATIADITPDPVYYSQTLRFNVTASNPRDTPFELAGGNVDTTTDFDVEVLIYEQANPSNLVYANNITITSNLNPDESEIQEVSWPAFSQSGIYVIDITADIGGDIAECDEGDNTDSDTFELLPVTIPDIFIDDVNTTVFARPNMPYRFDIHMRNSDGDILENATVVLTETNGLNLAFPGQLYNRSTGNGSVRDALVSKSVAQFTVDINGNASFTVMPTHNSYYNTEYSDLLFSEHSGNYSLTLSGNESDGLTFNFIINETLLTQYPLYVANLTYNGTYENKSIYDESFVAQALDFVYHTYVNFLDTIAG